MVVRDRDEPDRGATLLHDLERRVLDDLTDVASLHPIIPFPPDGCHQVVVRRVVNVADEVMIGGIHLDDAIACPCTPQPYRR